jgi:hypothetical protein
MTSCPPAVRRLCKGVGLFAVLLGLVAMHQLSDPVMYGHPAMVSSQMMPAQDSAPVTADQVMVGMCAHQPCVARLSGTHRPALPGAILLAATPVSAPRAPAIPLCGPASRAPPGPSLTSLCVSRT